MKANIVGFLAATALGLSSMAVVAESPAEATATGLTDKVIPVVEVMALDQDQAERLLSERKRHQEALKTLQDEHEKALNEIFSSTAR